MITIVPKVSPILQGEEAGTGRGSQKRAAPIRPARPAKPMVLTPTEKAPLVGFAVGTAVPELAACVDAEAGAAAPAAEGELLGAGAAPAVVPGTPAIGVALVEGETQVEFVPVVMLIRALYWIVPVLSLIAMEIG